MSCLQPLTVNTTIMFNISVSDFQSTASFVGRACGGTFTAGETLVATTNAPGQILMELTGGATFTRGTCNSRLSRCNGSSTCNGVRINNVNSSTVSTTGAGATITLKHGWASSSTGSVFISTPCTLTRLTTVAAIHLYRHGQRSPYPPPHESSAAGYNQWSTRELPSAAAWNMTPTDFNRNLLTPNGHALMRHMGEFIARSMGGDPCSLHALLVADGLSQRDLQSAQEFAAGMFPTECVAARTADIVAATPSSSPLLAPVVLDHAVIEGCSGPDEDEVRANFGGDVAALTNALRRPIERVGTLIGCCSASVCAQHSLGPNCTLSELPATFQRTHYWEYFDGPLAVAGYFAEAFVLQATSGLEPFAWGEVPLDELAQLYRVHERMMWLGSGRNSSRAYASHALAYLVASLEQVVRDAPVPGVAHPSWRPSGRALPSPRPLVLALFAHDFNLLYLRRLLDVHWVTESFDLDAATTGSSLSLELTRSALDGEWRVVGTLTAASMAQQRSNLPLVPPHAPPGRATFLDVPYTEFRARALQAIDQRCVLEPLRSTVAALLSGDLSPPPPPSDQVLGTALGLSTGAAAVAGACLLGVGCLCGALLLGVLGNAFSSRKVHQSSKSSKTRAEAAMDDSDFGGGGFNMEMNEAAIAAAKSSHKKGDAI